MATIVKQAILENDVVALTQAVDKNERLTQPPGPDRGVGKWPAGTTGTVVSDLGDLHKMVEISDDEGVALDFITVPVEQLEPISKHSFQTPSRTLPGLGSGQILPVWLSERLRRILHRTGTHAAR
ncbi:MAG: hypothetical protein ACRDK7_13230 [Solirubrobacteraceae bacterium]